MKWIILLSPFLLAANVNIRSDFQWAALSELTIQDRGRLKPLDTFATESVLYVTGKRTWAGMSAVEVIFSWLFNFDQSWQGQAFIRVDYTPLKTKVGLESNKKYFTPNELRVNRSLGELIRESVSKEQRKEKMSELEKRAIQIQNQMGLIQSVVSGQSLFLFPNPQGIDKEWFSLASLADQLGDPLPYKKDDQEQLRKLLRQLLESYGSNESKLWNDTATSLSALIRDVISGGHYPSHFRLQTELHYNHLRPFRWAWAVYLVSFVGLVIFMLAPTRVAKIVGFGSFFIGLILHVYGIILRCSITGRPPVTNMYESVIWVSFGCLLFSLILYAKYRNTVILSAATVFAVVGLILADNLPSVLDPSIHPLVPVLRSNFWLTIHVLTITLSYAAFGLSLCLGNVVLGNYLVSPKQNARIEQLSMFMYRAQQIGVVLLAAGTILGGVWADYSWGRFWGWDPKEVWALIALLVYVAVLHGRLTGWLRGFGFVTCTVLCFLAILMAWYGVNFVLGVGLHSYGFGTGGLNYVLGFVTLQLVFIGLAFLRYRGSF